MVLKSVMHKPYIYMYVHTYIKMSGSKSRPRKVEIMRAQKTQCNNYCEYFTHNNRACKHPYKQLYHIEIFINNGLYKITIESIKLKLDVKQFGMSNDLIIPTPDVQKVSLLCILLKIPWIPQKSIFSLEFTMKSKTSINNSMSFALPPV